MKGCLEITDTVLWMVGTLVFSLIQIACTTEPTTDTDTPNPDIIERCVAPPCGDASDNDITSHHGGEWGDRPTGLAGRVHGMDSDNDASLWLGTEQGLASLSLQSGEIKRYTVENSDIRSNQVKAVAVDGNAIWCAYGNTACDLTGSLGCGLSKMDIATESWTHYDKTSHNLFDNRIHSLFIHSTGFVVAGSELGLLFYANESWSEYFDWTNCAYAADHCEPLWSASVSDAEEGIHGGIWIAVNTQSIGISPKPGGIAHRLASTLTNTWDMEDGLPSNRGQVVAVTEEGTFAGSNDGISYLPIFTLEWSVESDVPARDLLTLSNQSIWAATDDGVLTRSAGGIWQPWDLDSALPEGTTCLYGSEHLLCFGGEHWVDCYDTETQTWVYHPQLPSSSH